MRQPSPLRRVRAAVDDVQHARVGRRLRERGVDGAFGALRGAVAVDGGDGGGGGEGEGEGPGAEDGVVALFVGGVEEGCAVWRGAGLAGAEEGVVEGGGEEGGERGGGGEAVEVGEGAEVEEEAVEEGF